MGERKDDGKKRKYVVCFAILWCLQMTLAFWFCTRKQGFHEDEYYTYYSTARTNGFYVEDGKWMERDTYRNEFVVLPGERFQYGLVKQVQSWDVHPPMYYWVFHTVASLVPGVFSKWTGLSVNLIFHGINLILLTYLSCLAAGKDGRLPLLVMFVYGFSPAAMSGVVFIRMYEMLATFVLLCAVLHVRAVQKKSPLTVKSLLAMSAVTYVGFLTHYYYFIFLFFLAAAFCVWLLWRDRAIGNCLRYGFFQGLAFAFAYLSYPAFPGQMFRGQRGAQAAGNFFDPSNTWERLGFFLNLMNGYVFGYLLFFILLVPVFLYVAARRRRKALETVYARRGLAAKGLRGSQATAVYFLLMFAAAGYFLVVSKTALLLGETSNRYQLPVYGIVVLVVFLGIRALWELQFSGYGLAGAPAGGLCLNLVDFAVRHRKGAERAAAIFAVGIVCVANLRAGVVFLYPEDREQTVWAESQAAEHTPVIYFYRPGEEWCIWDVANELLAYPGVCFAAVDSAEPVADAKIQNADSLVVYLAKGADAGEQFARLSRKDGAPVQDGLQLMFEEKYCDVYYLLR